MYNTSTSRAPYEFRAVLKYRLRIPLYDSVRRCPYCKSANLDIFGDQVVSRQGRSDIISCHDSVRDTIMAACSSANLSPVCEQKIVLHKTNQDQATGNVYLSSFVAGHPAALDVSTASQFHLRCGEDMWLCSNPSGRQKDWAILPEVQRHGHPFHTIGVRSLRRTISKNIEKKR